MGWISVPRRNWAEKQTKLQESKEMHSLLPGLRSETCTGCHRAGAAAPATGWPCVEFIVDLASCAWHVSAVLTTGL